MTNETSSTLAVCPVCEEVFEISGELPICDNCLMRLDRWAPDKARRKPSSPTSS